MEDLTPTLVAGLARALDVEASAALSGYITNGQGALPGRAKLLAWDANSIHAFVFDTTNATGIRGASDILRQIDSILRTGQGIGLDSGQVLFAGGGSGLAVVAEKELAPALVRLHGIFASMTQVATCTAAAVELDGSVGFAECVRVAADALARERLLTAPDAEPAVPFFAERCRVCGKRAAARREHRIAAMGELRPECDPCFLRIERGKRNLHYQHEPADFATIADAHDWYAVLYLDGNGIGRTIKGLASPLRYAQFSRAIAGVFEESVRLTAARHGLGEDGGGAPGTGFQLPICGGDDVVAILPGDVAVPFTRDLLTAIELAADQGSDLRRDAIGASAGVALARLGFPVRHLLAEAEDLLVQAKRRTYQDRCRSSLTFGVLTDGSPPSESRDPERWARSAGELLLSGRPYRLDEFTTFSRRMRQVRSSGLGRTQLHALHAHASRGPAQFRNHVLYQIGRHAEWRALVGELAGSPAALTDPQVCVDQFAPIYGGRQVFDVADMVELIGHWREPAEEPHLA